MSALVLSTTQMNIFCAICRDVYRAPRFLPCYHSFCLECLQKLSNRHGNIIPCPTCRAPAMIPPGGVCDLQVNFYFTEEALEQARSEESHPMCRIHTKECVIFHCSQCDQAICIRCKLTKHEGHATEDLSEAAARCHKTIKHEMNRLDKSIKQMSDKLHGFKENEKRGREKRDGVLGQIEGRYYVIVAMAQKSRDQAVGQLEEISDNLKNDTQRIQHKLNSLLQLQDRAQRAVSSACDTEVLEVEREMTRGEGSSERLRELESALPNTSYRPGLHGDFTNDIEDYIKRYIGSPVKQRLATSGDVAMVPVGRCGNTECSEVHSLRQRDDRSIDVFYGGTGGDFCQEKRVLFMADGSKTTEVEYGMRVSHVSHKNHIWKWDHPSFLQLASKDESTHGLFQNCKTNTCYIRPMELKQKNREETLQFCTPLIYPKVKRIHNFDSNKQGSFFAVVEGNEDANLNSEPEGRNEEKVDKSSSRVVRLFSNKSDDPLATYTPPKKTFFPTDVCFCGDFLLMIADWMNDCIHVTKVTNTGMTFIDYLPGSYDIVRPTALNLDLNGHLLIGCGDGQIFKSPAEICGMYGTISRKRNSQGLFVAH